MASGQDYRYDIPVAKRSPSKSMPRSVLSSAEIYPGSGTKLRPRQSLRTPQQHVPLKFDDRVKNRRASKSFVLLDQSDLDTPRARIEAFMGTAESVQKILPSATKRKKSLQALTPRESVKGLFKAPRVSKLAANGSIDRSIVSSPGSKFTPRSNIWNLLLTGEEKSPMERTVGVNEAGTSPSTHNLTSVRNAGQRVSISPIDVSSVGTEKRHLRQKKASGSGKARRRSFHLSSDQIGIEEYSPESISVTHSGQRVSISPINVSDHRVENNDLRQTKYKASRRSFHLDVPYTEEQDEQNENSDDWKVSSENNSPQNEIHVATTRNKSSPNSKNYEENSNEDWRKTIPVAKRREEEVTGVLDLAAEHTSLVIGGGTDMISQGTSLGPNTKEISLINHSMRQQRKSSVSKNNVSVGRELSISTVEPIELSEGMESKGTPDIMADQGVETSSGDKTRALGDGTKDEDNRQELSSGYEQNQVNNISAENDDQNQLNINRQSLRDEAFEEDKNPMEESSNPETLKKTTDAFRLNTQEKVVDNLELRREIGSKTKTPETVNSKNSNEVTGFAIADPTSVYDLSEGSSSSTLEGLNTNNKKIRGNSSKQSLRSGKRKTPGSSAKGRGESSAPSVQKLSSSKRKRLEFSELRAAETGGFGSPSHLQTLSNSPRSSTPVDRSRRFFHSTKIQRSMTEFFQGNQDLASASTAMTPRTKDLFSDISPIRPLGALQKSEEKQKTREDVAEGSVGDLGNDNEELISKQTSSSKTTNRIDMEDGRGSQSSDEELPSFSSMATPHIDLQKRVFVSSLHRKTHSVSRSKVDKTQQKIVKSNQPKKTAKQPTKTPVTNLPKRTVKYFSELHSDMKLSKDAIEEVEKVSEHFWVDTFKALEAYALHAGRKSVQDADVILLMKTQRLISGTDDLHNKIRQLMPMELRKELIPCAFGAPRKK